MKNNHCYYWSEVKRIRNKKAECTNVIDGVQGSEEIPKHLASKFGELHNSSVQYDRKDLQQFVEDLNNRIRNTCTHGKCNDNHTMTPVDVTRAIARLKPNKHDLGYMGHYGSDMASIDLIRI